MPLVPYSEQKQAAKRVRDELLESGTAALEGDTGIGKTVIAHTTAKYVGKHGKTAMMYVGKDARLLREQLSDLDAAPPKPFTIKDIARLTRELDKGKGVTAFGVTPDFFRSVGRDAAGVTAQLDSGQLDLHTLEEMKKKKSERGPLCKKQKKPNVTMLLDALESSGVKRLIHHPGL